MTYTSTAHTPTARPSHVIAVASGKGGVGKTWFSTTLAHSLAMEGKSVCLFDGDLGLANIDIQLGLKLQRDLSAYLDGSQTLLGCKTHYKAGGFDVIAGQSGSGSFANLPESRLRALAHDITGIADTYDLVILDLGAGIDRTVKTLMRAVSRLYVVVTEEPTSLTDAYALIKTLHQDSQQNPEISNLKFSVVVNFVETADRGRNVYEGFTRICGKFLNMQPEFAGAIRRDPRVPQSIRAQTPLIADWPGTHAAEDVKLITADVAKIACMNA